MPSYTQYKKMLSVLDYDDSDIESWITVKGNHIPIRKGQTKEEAVNAFIESKNSESKGDYTIAHKDKSGNTTVIAEVSHHEIGGEEKPKHPELKKAKPAEKPRSGSAQKPYTFHEDAGHGWLEVPLEDLEGLDLDISEFSYTDGKNIYLEEDADAPAFEKAYKEKWGEDPVSHEQNDGDYSRIRDMDMYKNPNKKEEPQRGSIGSFFDNSNAEIMPFLEMSGYEPKTTFWTDFSIADAFGEKAVEDTFNRAFNEWKNDKEYVTELVMMLNWKIWSHHDKGNEKMARLYDKLWTKADKWAMTHLKGDDLKYFLRTTD